jgi:hypothetical protein
LPAALGVCGTRGLLTVPVVGVEPLLGFGWRQGQLVAAEEFGERDPVVAHLLPALLDFFRSAACAICAAWDLGKACMYPETKVPFAPRPDGEVDQGTLQFRAALHEGIERSLGVSVVHGCHGTSFAQ